MFESCIFWPLFTIAILQQVFKNYNILDTGQVIKENGHCVGPTIKGVLIKL